jgi:hypothetical protein
MRIVGEIPHNECKITIFAWNNKYLIKLEKGALEQTFKISEFDISSEEELHQIVSKDFLEKAIARFQDMGSDLAEAIQGLY